MSCLKDVEKAILDKIFLDHIGTMPTFVRIGRDVLGVSNQARNKADTLAKAKAQAKKILNNRLKAIMTSPDIRGHVRARFNEVTDYSPISVTLVINPAYVQHIYDTQANKGGEQGTLFSPTPAQNQNINDLKSIEPAYAPYTNEQIQAFIESKIPDSQVKEVVFHGSKNKIVGSFKPSIYYTGFYFTNEILNAKEHVARKQKGEDKTEFVYPTLINAINPIITSNKSYQEVDELAKMTKGDNSFGDSNDSIIAKDVFEETNDAKNSRLESQFVVFEPSQITILNSPETIAEFKEFVNKSGNNTLFSPMAIDYQMKAVNILASTKADEIFRKGDKASWRLDRILDELQVPKQQQELLKGYNTRNREQLLTNLLADYSYTVEINTAKHKAIESNQSGQFVLNGWAYRQGYSRGKNSQDKIFDKVRIADETANPWDPEYLSDEEETITQNEFERARLSTGKNTQHYSNLTVPGGTNYTENEIATPAIVPSIKGHAEFATDNGIGWFRSDDRQVNIGGAELNQEYFPEIEQLKNGKWEVSYMPITGGRKLEFFSTEEEAKNFVKQVTKVKDEKVRRILEVQSDLFQKGRDKDNLITNINFDEVPSIDISITARNENRAEAIVITDEEYVKAVSNSELLKQEPLIIKNFGRSSYYSDGQFIYFKAWNTPFKKPISEVNLKETQSKQQNQFLQLLNKDNNWVTFFVKSIVQDSAKKGYKKVLFPVGDTAAKIEGHETVQGFIDNKEARIQEIKNKKSDSNSISADKYFEKDGKYYWYDDQAAMFGEESDKEISKEVYKKGISGNLEIQQLEKEIADAKAGKLKISSIAKFYEETVFNVLKKQGYNPEKITDEYSNSWYEVSGLEAEKQETILLSPTANNQNSTGTTLGTNPIQYASPKVGYFEKLITRKKQLLAHYESKLKATKQKQTFKGVTLQELKELNKEERRLKVEISGSIEFGKQGLKQEIQELVSRANVLAVGYYVERDLARLKLLANSEDINELNEAQKLIDFYQAAGTWTFPDGNWANPFFLEGEVYITDANGKLTTDFALQQSDIDQYEEWSKTANLSQEILTRKKKEIAVNMVNNNSSFKATYGGQVFDFADLTSQGTGMRDTHWIDMWIMDISSGIFSQNGKIASLMLSEISNEITVKEAIAAKFAERTDKLNATVLQKLAALGKTAGQLGINGVTQGVYNIFLERNANNQLTGGSSNKFNSDYQNEKSKSVANFWKKFKAAEATLDYNAQQIAFEKAFAEKRKWLRANTHIVRFNQMPEIIAEPEFAGYSQHFASTVNADAYKAELISIIGDREYNKQVIEQKRLIRKYMADRATEIEAAMFEEGVATPNLLSAGTVAALEKWTKVRSPFYGINDFFEAKFDSGRTSGNYQDYNLFVPRKTQARVSLANNNTLYQFNDSGVKLSKQYYNEDFENFIETDDDLYAFHELLTEAMTFIRESASPELASQMAVNFLASLEKTSAEIITDKADTTFPLLKAVPAFKQWWDKFRQSFGTVKQKDVSHEYIDPKTGKPNYKVSDSFLRDNASAIDDRMFLEKVKFLRTFNATQGANQVLDLGKFSTLDISRFNPSALIMLSNYLGIDLSVADAQSGNITELKNRVSDNVQMLKVLRDYATHETVKDNSFDLAKIIKHFTHAAAVYSARTEAMPRLELLKKYYDNIDEVQTNNVITDIYNLISKRNQSKGKRLYAISQMGDWWERVVLDNYGGKHFGRIGGSKNSDKHKAEITALTLKIDNINTPLSEKKKLEVQRRDLILKDKVALIDKTIYSKAQATEFADIETLLRTNGKTVEELQKEIEDIANMLSNQATPPVNPASLIAKRISLVEEVRLRKMQASLGKTRTVTSGLENFLGGIRTFRLGWNLSSGITNMMEGWSSNMIIAATGQYFKEKEIFYGYHVTKLSMIKNASSGKIAHPLAVKNTMLMEMFDVLMDSKNELQKASVKTFSDKLEKINPHALNQRIEFVNQSALMIAIARSTMIKDANGNESTLWDAYGTNKQLKPAFRTTANIENWEELKGQEYQQFRNKLRKTIVLAHGNYDEMRGMMAKSNIGGKALMMFKTWLPQQLYWRFAVEQDDVLAGNKGFKGTYRSYRMGGAGLHAGIIGLSVFGFPGAVIGLGLGLALGAAQGDFQINLLKESSISALVLAKKMFGMPLNSVMGRQVIDTSGKEFDSLIGGKFTAQDAANYKANMSDISIQLVWLALMLLAKGAFWDDDDEQDSKRRQAHNILVNRLLQLSSQGAMYVNPVDLHKNTLGSVAVLQYLHDLGKELVAVNLAFSGEDELQSGVNAGESRLLNQTKKIILPGIFKSPTSLGFESAAQTQFQKSPWDSYFKEKVTQKRRELKEKREAEGVKGSDINKELTESLPTKKLLQKAGVKRQDWLNMTEEERQEKLDEIKVANKEAREEKERLRAERAGE